MSALSTAELEAAALTRVCPLCARDCHTARLMRRHYQVEHEGRSESDPGWEPKDFVAALKGKSIVAAPKSLAAVIPAEAPRSGPPPLERYPRQEHPQALTAESEVRDATSRSWAVYSATLRFSQVQLRVYKGDDLGRLAQRDADLSGQMRADKCPHLDLAAYSANLRLGQEFTVRGAVRRANRGTLDEAVRATAAQSQRAAVFQTLIAAEQCLEAVQHAARMGVRLGGVTPSMLAVADGQRFSVFLQWSPRAHAAYPDAPATLTWTDCPQVALEHAIAVAPRRAKHQHSPAAERTVPWTVADDLLSLGYALAFAAARAVGTETTSGGTALFTDPATAPTQLGAAVLGPLDGMPLPEAHRLAALLRALTRLDGDGAAAATLERCEAVLGERLTLLVDGSTGELPVRYEDSVRFAVTKINARASGFSGLDGGATTFAVNRTPCEADRKLQDYRTALKSCDYRVAVVASRNATDTSAELAVATAAARPVQRAMRLRPAGSATVSVNITVKATVDAGTTLHDVVCGVCAAVPVRNPMNVRLLAVTATGERMPASSVVTGTDDDDALSAVREKRFLQDLEGDDVPFEQSFEAIFSEYNDLSMPPEGVESLWVPAHSPQRPLLSSRTFLYYASFEHPDPDANWRVTALLLPNVPQHTAHRALHVCLTRMAPHPGLLMPGVALGDVHPEAGTMGPAKASRLPPVSLAYFPPLRRPTRESPLPARAVEEIEAAVRAMHGRGCAHGAVRDSWVVDAGRGYLVVDPATLVSAATEDDRKADLDAVSEIRVLAFSH